MFDVEPMIIKDITYQNYVNYESTDIATPHNIIICIQRIVQNINVSVTTNELLPLALFS